MPADAMQSSGNNCSPLPPDFALSQAYLPKGPPLRRSVFLTDTGTIEVTSADRSRAPGIACALICQVLLVLFDLFMLISNNTDFVDFSLIV